MPKLDHYLVPIGRARIARAGSDVTIVTWSISMTYAEELAKAGIGAELIDLRTLRPMDTEAVVNSVRKTGRCVVVEECCWQSGIGAEVAARIVENAFDYLDVPVARVSGKHGARPQRVKENPRQNRGARRPRRLPRPGAESLHRTPNESM